LHKGKNTAHNVFISRRISALLHDLVMLLYESQLDNHTLALLKY
jgi:hypothetical protein